MAFAGMVWGGAILIIILVIFSILCLSLLISTTLGFVFRKKHKTVSIIMFSIAGVILAIIVFLIVGSISASSPKPIKERTRDGDIVEIQAEDWSRIGSAFDTYNYQAIIDTLNEHPELAYFYDTNHVNIIDYGLYNLNVDVMKCALEHGAVFDDQKTYKRRSYECGSLNSFYQWLYYPDETQNPWYQKGAASDEMIEAVRFAIENGAQIVYTDPRKIRPDSSQNFYEQTWIWVNQDDVISDKDWELLDLVKSYMPEDWSIDDMYDEDRQWYGRDFSPDARVYKGPNR
ncbi:MAG: hypothetical protein IJ784_08615 [Ruminiclostridium sp.]|nr:hypothetical protein [Ruminiclostridium sp.]